MEPTHFQGERVALRAFEPDDVEALGAYLTHPDLTGRRYIPWKIPDAFPLSRRQIEQVLETWAERERSLHLAVVLREAGTLVGHTNCSWRWDPHCPSIDVVIAPTHQRQGSGSEVARLMLRYLFERTPAHVVTTGFASWNAAAGTFARHLGFTETGAMRHVGLLDGEPFDWATADLLKREWLAQGEGQERSSSDDTGR
jgi:RimJ/RimL family protein N-acetyltransferase